MKSILTLLAMAMLAVSVGCDYGADAPAKPEADKPAATDSSSTTGEESAMTTVSLNLPGMT